jgi:hypothetical protein
VRNNVVCIHCLKDKAECEFSDEHVFCEAIGGAFVIKNVCKYCNDRLGERVDAPLVNHHLIVMQRNALGLRGKSGRVPNPFKHGVLAADPSIKVHYRFNDDGTPDSVYVPTQVTRQPLPDDCERVRMVMDATDAPRAAETINKILERGGRPYRVTQEDIEPMLKPQPVQSEIRHDWAMSLVEYKRGVLKIAYEMAAYWLGQDYVEQDPTAAALRACIWDFSDGWPAGHIVHGRIDLVAGQVSMFLSEKGAHMAWMMGAPNGIACYVRVFDIFEGTIKVAADPRRYPAFSRKLLAIDPVTGECRESTLEEELARQAGLRQLVDGEVF